MRTLTFQTFFHVFLTTRTTNRAALLFLLLALFILGSLPTPSQAREPAFTIVHVSDTSKLESIAVQDRPDMRERGGMARISAVIDAQKERGSHVLVTNGGGVLSPSGVSLLDDGAHMINVLSRIGIDAMAAGSHDFDFGPDTAVARFGEARFPVLIANARQEDGTWLENTQPSILIAAGESTIGIVGAVTLDVTEASRPGNLTFSDPVEAIVSEAGKLRDQGAQVVIALAHLNAREDTRLLESGAVDLILGGYDERTRVIRANGVPLVETERDGQAVAVIDVFVDEIDREVLPDPAELQALLESEEDRGDGGDASDQLDSLFEATEIVTEFIPSFEIRLVDTINVEPEVFTDIVVRQYETRFSNALSATLGETAVALDSRQAEIRSRETNFGNLVADVMRDRGGADVALVNAGSIRGDRLHQPGYLFTLNTVLEELPIDNRVVVLRLAGSDLRAALAHSLENEGGPLPRFLQVSGLDVRCRRNGPVREITDIMIDGQPLDPDRDYTVATTDFLADGGDGYEMLTGAPRVRAGNQALPRMSIALADHFREAGTVSAAVEGRIACD